MNTSLNQSMMGEIMKMRTSPGNKDEKIETLLSQFDGLYRGFKQPNKNIKNSNNNSNKRV